MTRRQESPCKSGEFIVGSHPQMQELENMIAHVAPTPTSVLLLGETGTGKAIDQRAFRADLFYRLNAFTLRVPPLRERRADIPLLAYHFLKRAQAKINKRVTGISLRALSALQAYDSMPCCT